VFEPVREGFLLIFLVMVVGAVGFLTSLTMEAWLDLEEVRVELLLLPAMAAEALVAQTAPILVGGDNLLGVPVLTHLIRICEDGRLPSVILPVVRIDAHVSLMVVLSVRTPDALEVEEVEVQIRLELLDQLHRQLRLRVRKRAKISVLTLRESI